MQVNQKIIDELKNCNNVAIFTHVNPDGDCLGSASALKQALVKLNKTADIYCHDNASENYLFIKHIDKLNQPQNTNYDLAVAVDCSDLQRLGKYADLFKSIPKTIKIDHHKTNDNFAEINEVVATSSSVCLMMYYYILQLTELDGEIANALFAGISSDTGSFMHSSTTSLEHLVASELLKYDFNLELLNYNLFKKRTFSQIKLLKIS